MKSLYLKILLACIFITVGLIPIVSQNHITEDMERVFSEVDFNSIYYPERAKKQYDSLLVVMSKEQQLTNKGYLRLINAQLFYGKMKIDSSLHLVDEAIVIFTQTENHKWLSRCQYLLGKITETTGLYEQAKINFYKALKLKEENKTYLVGSAYIAIARCKLALREEFREEVDNGIEILKKASRIEVRLYGEFMEQYFNLQSPSAPIELKKLAKKYVEYKMFDRAVNVFKITASSYHAQDMFDSAQVYCDKAIELSNVHDVGKLIVPALYQFKGLLYFKQQNYSFADVYFGRSLELYEKNNQSNRMFYTYYYLHQMEKAKNNYKKAYENLLEYNAILEKTKSEEKVRMAKVLEVINKVELMQSQLVQLKTEKKASEFMLYLVLVVTVVILSGVGVYVYLYQKSKKAKIAELNKEFHNLLIGIGEKQLLEHRLNKTSSRKNKKSVGKIDVVPSIEGVDEVDIGDSFDSCYMETINLFTDSFPQLTKTEVRYSVMICLRLPIEVIAKVQNVQPASIRKAKQRIRTKLNVEDSLEDYLQEFRETQISNLAG